MTTTTAGPGSSYRGTKLPRATLHIETASKLRGRTIPVINNVEVSYNAELKFLTKDRIGLWLLAHKCLERAQLERSSTVFVSERTNTGVRFHNLQIRNVCEGSVPRKRTYVASLVQMWCAAAPGPLETVYFEKSNKPQRRPSGKKRKGR